jgi:hypothetical protein
VLDDEPVAYAVDMDGSELVTKLPQIPERVSRYIGLMKWFSYA